MTLFTAIWPSLYWLASYVYLCNSLLQIIHSVWASSLFVVIDQRLPSELQKRLLSLLSAPAEQIQVLSSAVLRETLPLSGQEVNVNQENLGQLSPHAAALLVSQVCINAFNNMSSYQHYNTVIDLLPIKVCILIRLQGIKGTVVH